MINVQCACVQSINSYLVVSHTFDFFGYVYESLHQCHRNSIISALLDSGFQVNFITDTCAQSFKLSRKKCHLPIVEINSMRLNAQKLSPVLMSSRFENISALINPHVLPSISNELPARPLKSDHLNIPKIVKC